MVQARTSFGPAVKYVCSFSKFVAGANHAVEAGFFHAEIGEEFGAGVVIEFADFRFQLVADRDYHGALLGSDALHLVEQRIVRRSHFRRRSRCT